MTDCDCGCEDVINMYRDILLDVLWQSCGDDGVIDNCCISAYERACLLLMVAGVLERVNDRIYKVKKSE